MVAFIYKIFQLLFLHTGGNPITLLDAKHVKARPLRPTP